MLWCNFPNLFSMLFQPNCTVKSFYLVDCIMPPTEVPTQFLPFLDDSVANQNNSLASKVRRKRRSSAGTIDDDKISTYWKRSSAGHFLKRRTKRDLLLVSGGGSKMTVYVMLKLNNFFNVSASYATLLLQNPPSVNVPGAIIKFYPNHSQIVEITVCINGNSLIDRIC